MKAFKNYGLAVIVACLLAGMTGLLRADEKVYQTALRSTVWIVAGNSAGSGVLVDAERKQVVTNFHVVNQRDKVVVCFPRYEDGRLIAQRSQYARQLETVGIGGRVVSRDPKRDLALIEIDSVPEGAVALQLAKESPSPGQTIHSVGNPKASEALWVYTSGTVRQVYATRMCLPNGYPVEAQIVEAQSPVNPGDSGGPAVNEQGELIGIVQSFQRDAHLVSHCIDVSEVRAFMSGDIKTIDKRVSKALDAANLKYSVSTFGVFKIIVPDSTSKDYFCVLVASTTRRFGAIERRQVWSVAHVLEQPLDVRLANWLLLRNEAYKLGAWQLAQGNGKHLVIFCADIDVDSKPEQLHDVLRVVFQVVSSTRKDILRLTAAARIDPTALLGQWQGEGHKADGRPVRPQLRLTSDGKFVWDEQSFVMRGDYVFAEGAIVVTVDGKKRRLGVVQSLADDKLVLQIGTCTITFVRRQATAEPSPASSGTMPKLAQATPPKAPE